MSLFYHPVRKLFVWAGAFEDRRRPRDAGFEWSVQEKLWWTGSPYVAFALRGDAVGDAVRALDLVAQRIQSSHETDALLVPREIPAPAGRTYLPYQEAGIWHMAEELRRGRRAVLCGDEQGLGKSIQAIGLANLLGLKKLLVVCPAGLRLNWARELERWHLGGEAVPLISGRTRIHPQVSVVASYELAERTKEYIPDLVIIDEIQYTKNPGSGRTKLILGDLANGWRGLVSTAPTILLTGTPIPNRPIEFWGPLFRCAPDVIDGRKYWPFARRFCAEVYEDGTVFGSKNEQEFYTRLRGSGFMVRRLKKDVLHELPPKTYKLVTFTAEGELKAILRREAAFDKREIYAHGVPVGSALPEIRHMMGLAKAPLCAGYVSDLLDGGTDKILVFAYHRDVIERLAQLLAEYQPLVVMGGVSGAEKQARVDAFQSRPEHRILLGQLTAAGTGFNLTAAADVVFAEASWVPGENEQCADRAHRIGQTRGVLIHYLVVEGSIDAHILGTAAGKAESLAKVLDGRK